MTPPNNEPNGSSRGSWAEWANHILNAIDEIKDDIGKNRELIDQLKIDVELLKYRIGMRAGLIGGVTGLVPSLIVLIWFLIKSRADTG